MSVAEREQIKKTMVCEFFDNITLLAKDSLYIFVETTANTADANPTDFLYTDQIQFDSGCNSFAQTYCTH